MSLIMDLHMKFQEIDKRSRNAAKGLNNTNNLNSSDAVITINDSSARSRATQTQTKDTTTFNPENINDKLGSGNMTALDDLTANKVPFSILEYEDGSALIKYTYNGVKYTVVCYGATEAKTEGTQDTDKGTTGGTQAGCEQTTESATGGTQPGSGSTETTNTSSAKTPIDNMTKLDDIIDAYIDLALKDLKTNYKQHGLSSAPSEKLCDNIRAKIKEQCQFDTDKVLNYEDVEAKVNTALQSCLRSQENIQGDFKTFEEFQAFFQNSPNSGIDIFAKLGIIIAQQYTGNAYIDRHKISSLINEYVDSHKLSFSGMTKLDALSDLYGLFLRASGIETSDDLVGTTEYNIGEIQDVISQFYTPLTPLSNEQINQFFVEKSHNGKPSYCINYKAVLQAFLQASEENPGIRYQLPTLLEGCIDQSDIEGSKRTNALYQLIHSLQFRQEITDEGHFVSKRLSADQIPTLSTQEEKQYSPEVNILLQLGKAMDENAQTINDKLKSKYGNQIVPADDADKLKNILKDLLMETVDKSSYIKYSNLIDKLIDNAYLGGLASGYPPSGNVLFKNIQNVINKLRINPEILDTILTTPWQMQETTTFGDSYLFSVDDDIHVLDSEYHYGGFSINEKYIINTLITYPEYKGKSETEIDEMKDFEEFCKLFQDYSSIYARENGNLNNKIDNLSAKEIFELLRQNPDNVNKYFFYGCTKGCEKQIIIPRHLLYS